MGLDERSDEPAMLGGRYRMGAQLGRGGAATVHTAVDVVLGRAVAVKRYQPMGTATGVHRFAAEARLLAGLSHPGLVTVYDVCLEDDQPYLIMQLVNGPTLRDLLDRGPLPPEITAQFGARLADVLAYIHANDVIHRDIKPSNVLVDETGACHLADFGLARALSAAHLTASGEFVGTAAYLAPEQVTDIDTGPAVDIYSLGLLLLECLTGRTEYTGTTVEVALARLSRQPRIPESLPQAWRTLLTAMTARDPAARPDATHCADLLSDIVENPDAADELPRERRRWPARPVLAGLTGVAIAATVAAVLAMSQPVVPAGPTGEPPATDTRTVAPNPPVTAGTQLTHDTDSDPETEGVAPASDGDSPTDSEAATPPGTSTTTSTTIEGHPSAESTTVEQTSTPAPPTESRGHGRPTTKTKERDK